MTDKKIELSTGITTLSGEVIKSPDGQPFTVGKALAEILVSSKKTDTSALKLRVLAEKFYNSDEIKLDEADFKIIKNSVSAAEIYSVLITGFLERILDSIK